MPARPRVLIVGLDGAADNLMSEWMAERLLPTFASFAQSAERAALRCTWPPHTATGWTTLLTGRLPGAHGIFQFWDCQDEHYRLRATPSHAAGCPLLWDVFSAEGWTLGLINIPMSHPPGPWRGYQLTWPLVPTLHYSQPPELLREISDAGGLALPDIACMYTGSPDYPGKAKTFIRDRTRAMRHLISHRPTDVVMVVYPEIDRVSHHYWSAPADKESDRAPSDRRNVIREIYMELDAAFAELLSLVDEECVVLLVSDHGFGPGRRGLRIHAALNEAGFCSIKPSPLSLTAASKTHIDTQTVTEFLAGMDWEKTTAYMPTPGCFGLNLNRAGRQSAGTVSAEDHESVAAEIAEFLLEIKEPETGQAVFEAVIPSTIAYAGRYSHRAPDLLLVPRDPSLMLLHELDVAPWGEAGQSGLHRLEGVWMMRAPRVSAKAHQQPLAIEAVAGYLLHALGLRSDDIPFSEELMPATKALEDAGVPAGAWSVVRDAESAYEIRANEEVERRRDAQSFPRGREGALPDSEADIVERMRAMGYF